MENYRTTPTSSAPIIPAVEFSHFPDLPPELRELVWHYCLPERVCELDVPVDFNVFCEPRNNRDGPWPCQLFHTTQMNKSPPLISRVCHESRSVAFKAGGVLPFSRGGLWLDQEWHSIDVRESWQDRARDSAHLNWSSIYEVDFGFSDGSPLHCLAWAAGRTSRPGSFTLDYLENLHRSHCITLKTACFKDYRAMVRDFDALKRLSSWRVVVRIIVIHADIKSAAATGLFGLPGDAGIQLIDVAETARIEEFYAYAEECERKYCPTIEQDFTREPAAYFEDKIMAAVVMQFESEELAKSMRPVIMFRLCTRMCNRPKRRKLKKKQTESPKHGGLSLLG